MSGGSVKLSLVSKLLDEKTGTCNFHSPAAAELLCSVGPVT